MELGWLEDFLALADSGNFSRAAEARHLTQPAFSRRIRALEEWVGVPLFDRHVQPVVPTAAGAVFRPVADEMLRRLHQGREAARHAHSTQAQTLRFAATHSLSLTFFPNWLRELEENARPASIRLDSDNMAACENLLVQGQCQFLLCHHAPGAATRLDAQHFRSAIVGHDRLVPVAAPGIAPLPGTEEAPLPWLAYSESSGVGRAIDAALLARTRPAHLERVFTSHLATVLRAMARDGRGMAWLPLSLIEEDLAAGILVPVGGEDWVVAADIRIFRPRERLSPAAEAFWTIVAATERD
ncbi:LysR family transcriptional regulator [Telmatospirillum sp. J64-1]|uniref:LysR family transcriptional regulator n=1 Tax=Telmatospirillum sp. J64-1 TaxID=2502183 RepID=UPI00115ECC10|nr:LysR substrate-binding domain-containing protein [Telmatospirillum sp. J64-1]